MPTEKGAGTRRPPTKKAAGARRALIEKAAGARREAGEKAAGVRRALIEKVAGARRVAGEKAAGARRVLIGTRVGARRMAAEEAADARRAKEAPRARRSALPPPDPEVKEILDEILGSHPELRAGVMFGCPGYFVGKKAVACVFGDEANLTLPASRVAELTGRAGYRQFMAMGRAMTGWVLLDKARVRALAKAPRLIEEAIEYARSKVASSK